MWRNKQTNKNSDDNHVLYTNPSIEHMNTRADIHTYTHKHKKMEIYSNVVKKYER